MSTDPENLKRMISQAATADQDAKAAVVQVQKLASGIMALCQLWAPTTDGAATACAIVLTGLAVGSAGPKPEDLEIALQRVQDGVARAFEDQVKGQEAQRDAKAKASLQVVQ